jgi:HD-GYP domain-containing protein (c-di-GMP phosphodiesterase class II)
LHSVLEQSSQPRQTATTSRRYQIAVEDLRQQMFVVELDRPWLDTPFLLQGFLVDSQVELDALVRYCDYVYVDLELSSPEVADLIRKAEIRGAGSDQPTAPVQAEPPAERASKAKRKAVKDTASAAVTTAEVIARAAQTDGSRRRYRPRADLKVSQLTRQRFRQFVRETAYARHEPRDSLLERWFGWMLDLTSRARTLQPAPPADLLPADAQRTEYAEKHSMLEELPRARQAFSQGEAVLAKVMSDIRHGKAPKLESIGGAVDSMVASMLDNPDALMWIARLREEDINTYNHGVKVALYLVALGRHLGFPKQELGYLGQIGMLADIGKTRLPRALLDKPGMLTPAEFALVKEHVNLSLDIFAGGPPLPAAVIAGIAQHHERIDGSGYPNGLAGGEIGIYGKMTAIADSFAALITPRAYANAAAPQEALMNLYEWSGTSFHEPMVEQFVQAIGVFPVGSMIELTSGEIAVVVAHNRTRRLEPKVLILSNPDKSPLPQPVERDLLKEAKVKGSNSFRIARGLPAGAYGFKLRDYYLDEIGRQNGIIT